MPGVLAATATIILLALYRYFLPKPIPGIPYHRDATRSLFGDIPKLQREAPNNPFGWMIKQARRLGSPVCQFFIMPFGKPSVLVLDFHEGQDILMRRKEFDRSDFSAAVLGGVAPNFHINLRTGPAWKGHRRLLQDLMTPEFLHNVAAPNIYKSTSRLLELWQSKSEIAAGRPFVAERDIFYSALDAVFDFTFGTGATHRALIPQLQVVREIAEKHVQQIHEGEPVEFPVAPIHNSVQAALESAENVQMVASSGFPRLAWRLISLQPRTKRMRAARDAFIKEQIMGAVEKLHSGQNELDEGYIKSAIDLMMQRERTFAQKEGRDPVYWSEVMKDEVLGLIVAGHDTTSTTLCWGIKFLADNPTVQTRLRKALYSTHAKAFAEKRCPTHWEITGSKIPYLDAVTEEMLRLAHTAIVLDRECTRDTTVLGYHIPKGTLVLVANKGPSYTEPAYEIKQDLRSESSQTAAKEHGLRMWSEEGMDKFHPERWLIRDEQTGKEEFDATAGPTIPFGLGLRGCFGRKLAYMELKLLTTLLVWAFELMRCPENLSSYEDIEGLTRKPKQCYVTLKRI
ncbi:hypothetical protein AAE478_009013 [Parahypoxylon ruwenzoriense]